MLIISETENGKNRLSLKQPETKLFEPMLTTKNLKVKALA
jgi:hypothetical protein